MHNSDSASTIYFNLISKDFCNKISTICTIFVFILLDSGVWTLAAERARGLRIILRLWLRDRAGAGPRVSDSGCRNRSRSERCRKSQHVTRTHICASADTREMLSMLSMLVRLSSIATFLSTHIYKLCDTRTRGDKQYKSNIKLFIMTITMCSQK